MGRSFYRFRSDWVLDAAPERVYLALEDLEDYPRWWPEIRAVRRHGEDAAEVTCRSLLPYSLVFVTEQSVRDPQRRMLEARLTGDLEGFSRWTVTEHPEGARATFDEEVVANKALLRRLEVVARPAFRMNHSLMMRHGRDGLRRYLATPTPQDAGPQDAGLATGSR